MTAATTTTRRAGLPRAFGVWVAAESVSAFGDNALFFALGWAATGLGPRWAGLVLTAMTHPGRCCSSPEASSGGGRVVDMPAGKVAG